MVDGLEMLLAIIFHEESELRNKEIEAKWSRIAAGRESFLPDVANAHAIQREGHKSFTRGFRADVAALSLKMLGWHLEKQTVRRANNFHGSIRSLVCLRILISVAMNLSRSFQKLFVVALHPRRRSIVCALWASVTAQVIVWGLAENVMNGAANADLFNRPPVGLGVREALAEVDPLRLCDKFAVTHGTGLCMGSVSAFRALSPSQVIGRYLPKGTMFPADDRGWRFAVHVVVCVGKAISVDDSGLTFKLCGSLREMSPQGFRTAIWAATTVEVAVWRL